VISYAKADKKMKAMRTRNGVAVTGKDDIK
jgi:hypothetical protein